MEEKREEKVAPNPRILNRIFTFHGKIFKINQSRTNERIVNLFLTNYRNFIQCNFVPWNFYDKKLIDSLNVDDWVEVRCKTRWSNFKNEYYGEILQIQKSHQPENFKRADSSSEKRSEIIMHTKMSAFDGLNTPDEIIKQVKEWGWKSICVTDFNAIQSYPEFAKWSDENFKVIYGIEINVIPDQVPIVVNANEQNFSDKEYVVLDLETTGLLPSVNDIIEFAGSKYRGNQKIEEKSFLIKTKNKIPEVVKQLTHINDEMLEQEGKEVNEALKEIVDFVGNATLIAHNGITFDFPFLNTVLKRNGFSELKNELIDTMRLSWALNPESKAHNLKTVAHRWGVIYDDKTAHRAMADVKVLYEVWQNNLKRLLEEKVLNSKQLNQKYEQYRFWSVNRYNFPAFVYAKNQAGLKTIYTLLSEMLTGKRIRENGDFPINDPYISIQNPKVSERDLIANRENLILVNNPIEGDLLNEALLGNDENLEKMIKKYDFIAVSPPATYEHKIKKGHLTKEDYQTAIKKIITLATKNNKQCIATSDAYYLNSWQKIFHEILINTKEVGGKRHRFFDYYSPKQFVPDLHLQTTDEMIASFGFLNDPTLIHQIVVTNSQNFVGLFEHIEPIPKTKITFHNQEYEQKLLDLTWKNAKTKYGDELHPIILKRLERELESIVKNDYSTIYWVSHLLVEDSEKHGFPVGSRGSVGSSLVAMLLNITEVNPLPSHYLCEKCHYVEFVPKVEDGYDLPNKQCPCCLNKTMLGDGHNIPFETFLGLHGEKVPDIDLNFSGLYQLKAHEFVRNEFGETHTLRAGTVTTIAEKTALAYVHVYLWENGIKNFDSVKLAWYAQNITGVKRSTGQHPGGIIIFPKNASILDFTPFNYPANNSDSSWYTTHYSFEYLHNILLKLDLLGHDDPSLLKKLDETSYYLSQIENQAKMTDYVKPKQIPHHDQAVMDLFKNLNSLKLTNDDLLGETTGAIGLPEFGTSFVRQILKTTQPNTFADLVRISGLSHGTNVWKNNAETLLETNPGKINLADVIACRDDIMNDLTKSGIEPSKAFTIMENIRKGKSLTNTEIDLMKKYNIPEWYINSCRQIKYLFPKAHATAYTLMAWRIAWYKLYWPLAYYSAYFSYKVAEHGFKVIGNKTADDGKKAVINELKKLRSKDRYDLKPKEIELMNTYEVALEMFNRKIAMCPISLTKSAAKEYLIDQKTNSLIPPFIAISGFGEKAANLIVTARQEKDFKSLDDFKKRVKITKTNFESLTKLGVFSELLDNETNNKSMEIKKSLDDNPLLIKEKEVLKQNISKTTSENEKIDNMEIYLGND